MTTSKERILVIRLGALGDLVFCFQSFHEIRLAHPNAEIALLTRAPFAEFAKAMPWFDRVIIDTHPTFTQPVAWARLVGEIRAFAPTRVYDLQGKIRQTIMYMLLGGCLGVEWSGAAPLCKFPRVWPPTPNMHFTDFLAAQLRVANIPAALPPRLAWLDASSPKFVPTVPYAVLVPGCTPKALYKRWPPEKYAEVANKLRPRNLACLVVGTQADAEAAAIIKAGAPHVTDLCGQTNLFELAGLLRHASIVIGNDTGPMHLGAALGAPTLALFSEKTNPVWSKPPGKKVAWRQSPALADLSVGEVSFVMDLLLQHAKGKSRTG